MIEYDGLCVVHIEYDWAIHLSKEQEFKQRLIREVKLCFKNNIPVFVADKKPLENEDLKKLFEPAYAIPKFSRFIGIVRAQKEVDFISKNIGKKPKDIVLNFAGVYGNSCVYAYADSWCKEIQTIIIPKYFGCPPKPKNSIGKGIILEKLVIV